VCFADFGISLDWSELSRCTTVGPSYKTLRYCAPEVAANESRNSASDLWSLGCVFLEIWTTLCGETITNLVRYMVEHGSHSSSYYSNEDGIEAWCQKLTSKRGVERQKPLEWIVAMLKRDTESRCTAQMLCELIMEANNDPEVPLSFIGRCCAEDEDTAESVQSFADDDDPQQTSLPTPQDVFSLENSVSSISLPRFRTPLVQREEPQKHWSSIAVPPMPLSLKAYMTTPSPCLLKAESFTGNRTSESHTAAALPSGSTASLVTLSCEAVPERLPPAEETNSIEVRAPAGNRTSRQPLLVDLGMPHGRTEKESSGKAGTEPLDHRGFMPRDDKNAHREPYNPKLEPYSQKLETKRTSIETHVNSRLHPQPKSSTNLAEIVSKQHQQLSKSAAVLPSIGKQYIPIAHVEPAHALRPPGTHDIHGISNARTTHVFDRLPPSLLYSSLGQGQRRVQDPALTESLMPKQLLGALINEANPVSDTRHPAHLVQAQRTIKLNRISQPFVASFTTNEYIRSWYNDNYNDTVKPVLVRPIMDLADRGLSYDIIAPASRQYPTKDLYGNIAVVAERKVPNKLWNQTMRETIKVLDQLGFAYYVVADGFKCIYPWDLAGQVATTARNYPRVKGSESAGIACRALDDNKRIVLSDWGRHLDFLNKRKTSPDIDVENEFWPDWRAGRIIMRIHYISETNKSNNSSRLIKRPFRFYGQNDVVTARPSHYIGFTGYTGDPADIKTCLAQAILHCLFTDVISDPSFQSTSNQNLSKTITPDNTT
jgi:serine/threonine protein kinase